MTDLSTPNFPLFTDMPSLTLLAAVCLALPVAGEEGRQHYIGAVLEYSPLHTDHLSTAAEVTLRPSAAVNTSLTSRCWHRTLRDTWPSCRRRVRRGQTSSCSRSMEWLGHGSVRSRTGQSPGSSWSLERWAETIVSTSSSTPATTTTTSFTAWLVEPSPTICTLSSTLEKWSIVLRRFLYHFLFSRARNGICRRSVITMTAITCTTQIWCLTELER